MCTFAKGSPRRIVLLSPTFKYSALALSLATNLRFSSPQTIPGQIFADFFPKSIPARLTTAPKLAEPGKSPSPTPKPCANPLRPLSY